MSKDQKTSVKAFRAGRNEFIGMLDEMDAAHAYASVWVVLPGSS
jgi:hypothetical protein